MLKTLCNEQETVFPLLNFEESAYRHLEKVEVEKSTKQNIHAALLTYIKLKKKDQSDFTLTRKYK